MSISKYCLVIVRLRVCRVPRPRVASITVGIVIVVVAHKTVEWIRKLWRRAARRLAARNADTRRSCVARLLHGPVPLLILLLLLDLLLVLDVGADLRDRKQLVYGVRQVADTGHIVVVDEGLVSAVLVDQLLLSDTVADFLWLQESEYDVAVVAAV